MLVIVSAISIDRMFPKSVPICLLLKEIVELSYKVSELLDGSLMIRKMNPGE